MLGNIIIWISTIYNRLRIDHVVTYLEPWSSDHRACPWNSPIMPTHRLLGYCFVMMDTVSWTGVYNISEDSRTIVSLNLVELKANSRQIFDAYLNKWPGIFKYNLKVQYFNEWARSCIKYWSMIGSVWSDWDESRYTLRHSCGLQGDVCISGFKLLSVPSLSSVEECVAAVPFIGIRGEKPAEGPKDLHSYYRRRFLKHLGI